MGAVVDVVAAVVVLAVGVWLFRRCTRVDRRQERRLSDLRRRQLARERAQSEPISWRRG